MTPNCHAVHADVRSLDELTASAVAAAAADAAAVAAAAGGGGGGENPGPHDGVLAVAGRTAAEHAGPAVPAWQRSGS